MNTIKNSFFLLLSFICFSFSSNNTPKEFEQLLKRSQLELVIPDLFFPIKCIPNNDVSYDYALRYPGKFFEIRYSVHPLDSAILEFELKKNSNSKLSNPDSTWESGFRACLFNIASETPISMELPSIRYFDAEDDLKLFNADAGATALVKTGPSFGEDFKFCVAVVLHKQNIADAYIYYLFADKEDFPLVQQNFYSLKFR
jgi:hypothetical protein